MSEHPRHPGTGARIIHVISDAWGPFVDIRAMYEALAERHPWTHVISPAEFVARLRDWPEGYADPKTVFVLWEMIDPGPKHLRGCQVVHVFAEAMDENQDLVLPQHRAHWQTLRDRSVHYDAILAHTPWATEFVRKYTATPHVFTMPAGWDAGVMGTPRWRAPRHTDVLYHGSFTGRREVFVPYLAGAVAGWKDATGAFGRGLLGQLDTAAVSLYIAHSTVRSFSSWRIWQVASTAAAMVIEGECDVWPLTSEAYVQLPRLTSANARGFARELERISEDTEMLRARAKAAHEIARRFTVDQVEEEYLIPAIERMFT